MCRNPSWHYAISIEAPSTSVKLSADRCCSGSTCCDCRHCCVTSAGAEPLSQPRGAAVCWHLPAHWELGHCLSAVLLFPSFVYAPSDTHSWKCTFLGSSDTQNEMESLSEMAPLSSTRMCFVFLCPQKMGTNFWLSMLQEVKFFRRILLLAVTRVYKQHSTSRPNSSQTWLYPVDSSFMVWLLWSGARENISSELKPLQSHSKCFHQVKGFWHSNVLKSGFQHIFNTVSC